MRTIICFLFLAVAAIFFFSACMTTETQNYSESGPAGQEVLGYGILERIPGQWNGPVMTTTPAGSFDSWYVDFRPISYGEVAQYSNVDADTTKSYTFTNVHPGTYYIYSCNDVNNDKRHLNGDYMSSDFDHSFNLEPEGHAEVNTRIDFVIP